MKALIKYPDFEKLDLRILKVKKAEPHPNADKLIILTLEGEEKERQMVAGIKKDYNPKDLEGKKIVVLINLEPIKLRGVESNGMLLAAEDNQGKLSVLTTDKNIETNSKIG